MAPLTTTKNGQLSKLPVFYIILEKRKDRNEEFPRRNFKCAECCHVDAPAGELLRISDLLADGIIAESHFQFSWGEVLVRRPSLDYN
jgi:hypothetical protein